VAAARRLAADLGLDLRLPGHGDPPGDGDLPCDWPWTGAYITHRGLVQPCCMVMGDDRVVLGDLAEATLGDIWTGPSYQQFRSELLSPRPPAVCRGCSAYRRVF
jgi:radical SAM protein with 4Fe4S-binding SPASM domain